MKTSCLPWKMCQVIHLAAMASFACYLLLVQTSWAEPIVGITFELPPLDAEPEDDEGSPDDDRLYMEIVRQAVLLAARESFAAATRDEALRESLPDSTLSLLVASYYAHIDYELKDGDEVIASGSIPYSYHANRSGYEMAVQSAEEKSRIEFVEALKQTGLEPIVAKPQNNEPIDGEIEDLLTRMDAESQLAAIMRIHQAIREQGESPSQLTALARGYANLSQLTVFLHSPMRRVFGARALLYATRLIHLEPDSPEGLWARAYAFTMLGLSKASERDLNAAESLESELPEPPWVPIAKLSNFYDYDGLLEVAKAADEWQELGALLWYRSVEFTGSEALNLATGRRALSLAPRCIRVLHGMDHVAGVSYRHRTTSMSIPMYAESLSRSLPEFGELLPKEHHSGPASPDPKLVAALASRIVENSQDSPTEPSLEVLGRLIEETNFLHLQQRVTFMRDSLSVDTEDFLDEYLPVYVSHPMGPLLNACRLRARHNPAAYQELLGDLELDACDYLSTTHRLVRRVPPNTKLKNSTAKELKDRSWQLMSLEEIGRSYKLRRMSPEWQAKVGGWMAGFQPHAPQRFVALIKHKWEQFQHSVNDEFLERYGDHPAIALQLGKRYDAIGEWDKAEEFYRVAADAAPEWDSYYFLVLLYFKQDRQDEGIEVAEEFLNHEDYGLDHAKMNSYIAYTLMDQQKYDDALPWAERTASSYSGWGLECLAECYERMGRVQESAQLQQAIHDRYDQPEQYYRYAARTQNIDPQEAYEELLARLLEVHPEDHAEVREAAARHLGVLGDWAGASHAYEEMSDADADPYRCLMAGVLAGLAGDQQRRDELIRKAAEDLEPSEEGDYAKTPIQTAQAIVAIRESGTVDEQALANIADDVWHYAHPNVHFFVGGYLDSEERRSEAVEFYKRVATSPYRIKTTLLFATQRLRELDEDATDMHYRYNGFVAPAVAAIKELERRKQAEADEEQVEQQP